MKKTIKHNWKLLTLLCIISIIVSYFISKTLFPDYQFAILSDNGKDYISLGTKENIKYEIINEKGVYSIELSPYYIGKKIDITYTKEKNKINSIMVNGEKVNTYKLHSYNTKLYDNITLFNIKRTSKSFAISFLIISLSLMLLLSVIFCNEKYKVLKTNITQLIGKKNIIITSILILLTLFLVCGCDAKVIINCAKWFNDNVDIYQIQINTRNLLGTQYAQFPYNPISFFIYGGFFRITSFIFENLPTIREYPYFQVFTLKIINLVFVQATIITILNYLYNHKKINQKRLKLIYYLSILNPVTFYVAFLFVQIDPLSLFLISTGLVLLEKIPKGNYIGVLFLSLGLVIKTQLLVFSPIIILSLIVISFQGNKFSIGLKRVINSFVILFLVLAIFKFSHTIAKSSFYLVNSNLPQAERIYYTLINYMGSTSIFVSIFFVGLAIFAYVFSLRTDINIYNLTKSNILYLMALIFILSATIVPTPSIYVLSLPAFIVLIYDEKDLLKILMITFFSCGIIILPMLSDYGDITILFSGFNKQSFLMKFFSNLESANLLKINNIIFTISAASMSAYALLGIRVSKKLMEGKNDKK